jgi:hypothetical protein
MRKAATLVWTKAYRVIGGHEASGQKHGGGKGMGDRKHGHGAGQKR